MLVWCYASCKKRKAFGDNMIQHNRIKIMIKDNGLPLGVYKLKNFEDFEPILRELKKKFG